jgi:hypothetical protein
MNESMELIPVDTLMPLEVFTEGGIDLLLKDIEDKVAGHEPVLETAKGRKEIASLAYKVSQSKTLLDKFGKDLVTEWKTKAKTVDASRKIAREFLDSLRDRVRQPLTEWEEAEAARLEAERLAKELAEAEETAHAEHALWLRQKEIEAKEAELARQEEERRQAEEAARLEKERLEREEQMKQEAAEAARKQAGEEAQAKVLEAERKEREAKEATARAERERIAAEERAKVEKEMAVKEEQRKAKEEAERVERERLAAVAKQKAEDDKRAANRKHQANINSEAVAAFVKNGLSKEQAKEVVTLIAKGLIDHIRIAY